MAQIEVDVDLDDFDTDELVSEISRRLKVAIGRRKALKEAEIKSLKEDYEEFTKAFGIVIPTFIEIKSLDDQLKYEHLLKIWNKYRSFEFEEKLPE